MPGYREPPAFIGRVREREALRSALDEAASGRGCVVLVAGEAGIGKTHLAEDLAAYAASLGAAVYRGKSHEASGAPPFWPWIQAGRMAAEAGNLGDAPELASLFHGLARPPDALAPDGDAGRFLLFEAFAAFLRRAADSRPTLLMLEDIHWADDPSLELLAHVGRESHNMRLLILLTLRTGAEATARGVARVVASLTRDPGITHLELRPFTREEVAAFATETLGSAPGSQAIERLQGATGGNPLFLVHMTREIAEAGEGAQLRVPPSLSAVLAGRLDTVGATSWEALTTAAIIGREFSYQEILAASGLDADNVLAGLDDASGSHLITEAGGPGHYEFVHALMRQAVIESMTPGQRVRLHGRVAAALEAAGAGSSDEGQAALARHYREVAAFNAAHAGKAYHFSKAAASNAERHYAWSVAMAHYRYCLELEAAGHAPGEDRAWLLTRLATCQLRLVHPKTLATAQEAMGLYRGRGDGPGFARAALAALEHPATWDNQLTLTIAEEALALLGKGAGELEGRLLAMVAEHWISRDPYSVGEPDWLVRLQEAAAEHPLPRLTGCLHHVAAARARGRGDFEAVYRESIKAHEAFDRAGEYLRAGTALLHAGDALIWMGRFDEAAATGFEEMEFGSRRGSPFQTDEGAALAVSVALLRGESTLVDAILRRVGAPSGPTVFTHPRLLELSGDATRAIPAFRALLSTQTQNGYHFGIQPGWFGTLARLLFSAGELDEAQSWLQRWGEAYTATDAWDPFYTLRAIISVSDVLVALGTPDVQRLVYRRLDILRDFRVQSSFGLDRLRGDLAMALGSPAEAAAWYKLGLVWAVEAGSPIEQGLNLRGLAQIAAGEGRVGDATALGRQAADALQQAGAVLYLRPLRDWLDSLGTTSPGGKREQTEHPPGGLTQRETDVVRLVAAGASNHMIADELVISPATVARHISNILIKLNLTNRTEVATWALRHGIVPKDQ